MSKVKINSNLFIGTAEWWRLQKQFDDWGFKRHIQANTKTYGLVKDIYVPEIGEIETADNFYVSKINACNDKVSLNAGFIINKDGEYIVNEEVRKIDIPGDSNWYWIKVKHRLSHEELGTVDVDAFGNLTGTNTEFTEIFRGQPNFPTKIRFENSQNGNVEDYEVVSVSGDTNAVIQGDFTPETGLKFYVVGTFTPGYPVPTQDELIFQYDSFELQLIPESFPNQTPPYAVDYEFFLARVKSNGTQILIEDKRNEWWRPWGEWWVDYLDRTLDNPLIGVEGVQYTHKESVRDSNIMLMAWGMRFKSYTINPDQKKMSILIGNGGTFKDTSFFQNNDFNGWRVYAKNGSWKTIIDSQKSGTQIVLILDVLDPDDYGVSDELFIAPPYEEIEIRARKDNSLLDLNDQNQDGNTTEPFPWPNITKSWIFPINTQLARIQIPAFKSCYNYNITYRYKTFEGYTDWQVLPDDNVGYYNEKSYDEYGNLKLPIDRVQIPYQGHKEFGFIRVCQSPDSFINFKESVQTGDIFGVNTTSLNNAVPVLQLFVGEDKQYQHFKGNLNLSADMFINLNRHKNNGDPLREGNSFILHIDQWISLGNFKLRIVEDFIDPTNYVTLVELTDNELMYIRNNTSSDIGQNEKRGLYIICTYNDTGHWIVRFDTDVTPKGTVRMMGGNVQGNFDISGAGVRQGFWGWQIMNGNNGTKSMLNKFAMGVVTPSAIIIGVSGGQNSYTITAANLPAHSHTFSGTTGAAGKHDHRGGYSANNVFEGGNMPGTAVAKQGTGSDRLKYGNFYQAPDHTHSFSGTTDPAGGSSSPQSIDSRPEFLTFLYIIKTV